MKKIIFSRWFTYSLQIILIILIAYAFLFKTIYLGIGAIVLEIIILTITNIRDSKRDKDDNEVKEWSEDKLEEINEDVKEISLDKKETDDLIRIMINEGLINEKDLLKKIKQKTFIAVYCYQKSPNSLAKALREIIGRQPILDLLEELGFYRLGANHNFYLVDEKDLPKDLRPINQLEFFLSKRLEKKWANAFIRLKKEDKNLYKKYKEKRPWNFSYFIAKVISGNSLVGHINWSSFTPESKAKILRNIKPQDIQREINFHNISDFIKELNFKLLIRDISSEDKKELLKIKNIEKGLGIKDFRDYGRIQLEKYEKIFNKHFNSKKSKYLSKQISDKAKKFNDALDKFGIVIQEPKQ